MLIKMSQYFTVVYENKGKASLGYMTALGFKGDFKKNNFPLKEIQAISICLVPSTLIDEGRLGRSYVSYKSITL